ncbi:cystine transport system substrate-binding protein [Pseudobutyrivibrio sp. YE44]|uniref:transporter substrate-binding domain-containing protein n=1 Tax=Pseudobutyrivibrio sp. YE44 TaxID=1520802 RepID=UPI00088E8321|nr:transporter substrate-binding domain-containing protein [Pseudobutyrivibrio sp. YE44]SDB24413.1 cystine transport system substrate-binding protein [Pseudobutyrivibrio sp. YE44]
MKKKIIAMLSVMTISAAALVGCGSAGSADTTASGDNANEATDASWDADHLARIKEAGKITIATEGVWAPFTYHDADSDELVGFDVEVAAAIAEKLGVEPEFKEVAFDGGLTGVSTGSFDMMANGVDVTEERSKTYDFTDPYAYDHAVVVTLASNNSIKSFEDLNGKTTANSAGSTYEAMGIKYGATVSNVDTLGETMTLVLNGTVDATVNANTSVADYINTTGTKDLKVAATDKETTNYAIPLAKGSDNDSLREAINQAIKELKEDGTLAEISVKYFGTDITAE